MISIRKMILGESRRMLIGETGTTATGAAPFLAATNPAPFGEATYVPNGPLETSEPISGANGRNIFHLMGDLRYNFIQTINFDPS
jgi:hypothetical protein